MPPADQPEEVDDEPEMVDEEAARQAMAAARKILMHVPINPADHAASLAAAFNGVFATLNPKQNGKTRGVKQMSVQPAVASFHCRGGRQWKQNCRKLLVITVDTSTL